MAAAASKIEVCTTLEMERELWQWSWVSLTKEQKQWLWGPLHCYNGIFVAPAPLASVG